MDQTIPSSTIRKLYRLLIVSFGFLLLLQVLSILLHLVIFRSDLEATIGNLTEERDVLKTELELLLADSYDSEVQGPDGTMKDLPEEGDTFNLDMSNSSSATILTFEANIKTLSDEIYALRRSISEYYSKRGWVYFQNSFYFISSTKKSWQDSREECVRSGADLVIINSKEEQDFIRQFEKLTWIGLTDTKTEGMWKWVDGTLLNTSYWKTSSKITDDASGQNEKKTNWNSGECGNKNFWICEKMMAA